MHNYTDIYELLDALRKRPGMYLGNSGRSSFNTLIAFVTALEFANLEKGSPSFWGFSRWITGRVDGMSTSMPWYWMEHEWGNEKAFEMFFELLDEYRTCKSICLCRAIIREHKPKFFALSSDGKRIEPEKPFEVCVSQFAPANVYYLLEIYMNRHYEYFPYYHSIDRVKKEATSRWGVLNNEWF